MPILYRSRLGTVKSVDEVLRAQRVERTLNGRFIVSDDRITMTLLIAGVGQRIDRHRIIVWRGELLLDE